MRSQVLDFKAVADFVPDEVKVRGAGERQGAADCEGSRKAECRTRRSDLRGDGFDLIGLYPQPCRRTALDGVDESFKINVRLEQFAAEPVGYEFFDGARRQIPRSPAEQFVDRRVCLVRVLIIGERCREAGFNAFEPAPPAEPREDDL